MARELLDTMREIEEKMWALEGEIAGHVTIGCTTTAGKYVLPILAASFNQEYPNVQVTIEMCQCDSVEDPLLARDVHVGISDTRIVHRDMECQPFFKDQILLIAPVDHPFAERSSVHPHELCDQPFILREEGCSTCQMLEEALSAHQVRLDQLQVVMSVGNSEAIEMAVEHGLGVAFISRLAAIGGIESGRLVEVPVEGLYLERQLHAVRSLRYSKTPAEVTLWDFIGEHREEIAGMLEG
jgi:DNA-binding transcriptional LysR family regulator